MAACAARSAIERTFYFRILDTWKQEDSGMAWEDGETGYKDKGVSWKFIVSMLLIAAFGAAIYYCVR
jgi:hypothetical protein